MLTFFRRVDLGRAVLSQAVLDACRGCFPTVGKLSSHPRPTIPRFIGAKFLRLFAACPCEVSAGVSNWHILRDEDSRHDNLDAGSLAWGAVVLDVVGAGR